MDNKTQTNDIEVTYIWGDSTPAFQLACILAQKSYAMESMKVFKAYPNNRRNFMENYADEECILVFGLLDQDMDIYDLHRFLCGFRAERFGNISFANCKKIIITGYKPLSEWYFHTDQEDMDSDMLYSALSHVYEVRNNGSGMVDILEHHYSEYGSPTLLATHPDLDLDQLSLELLHKSPNGYFEDLSIIEYIDGTEEELRAICEQTEKLSLIERRKLRAMIDVVCFFPVSANKVNGWLADLDSHYYKPYIHTFKDYGHFIVSLNNPEWLSDIFSLYLDYECLGDDFNVPKIGKSVNKHITKYGYICGIGV